MKRFLAVTGVSVIALAILFLFAFCGFFNPSGIASADNSPILDEIYYGGDSNFVNRTVENINFYRVETETYTIGPNFPDYSNYNSNLSNACGPVAGSNVLGCFDRYYDNFIPNFTAGYTRAGKYWYFSMFDGFNACQNVINSLFGLMKTNNPNLGTSQTNFKTGLQTYVSGKGKTMSFTSRISGSSIDIEDCKSQFQNGNPIVLYCSGYNLCYYSINDKQTEIDKISYSGNHIMVAYGIKIIKYFDSNNNNFRTDKLLNVSTGIAEFPDMWYIIGSDGTLVDAESVHVN